MSDEHEAFIKTPKQLITVVVLAFVVPILVIVLLVKYVGTSTRVGAGADAMTAEAIEARIRPVAGFELAGASGPRAARSGEEVYKAQCATCHAAGVAGAPKLADNAAWADRIKTGLQALVNSALKGKGAMGAQGGGDYSDLEITRAVVYMANAAGGKFEEPKADAAPKAAEAAPAAAAPAPAAPAPAAAAPAPAAPAAAPAQTASVDGKKIYDSTCMVCHATGVAGAPKMGDKAAWADRVKAGMDTLVSHSINGLRAMPPRGGNAKLSDAEVRAAVEYMVAAVQ
ncbi:c-type cytochrome [Burkholderiaceae bacterium FT117]|uniref:c-type cytochrome n=1 Tax=Zeimonas sediminis TaxID=2944268 RepID=UPI002342BFBC|nr:c-type cytochrome [Zeimonas sediminis]MCM5571141.1 c-type cytochrome [Zeimonas sediminis]